jgi:hypothetical protein
MPPPPFQNGKLTSMSGDYYDIKMHQQLQASQNCFKAVNHIGASKYLWESPETSKIGYHKPEGELVFFLL